jgi:hypothetical protein
VTELLARPFLASGVLSSFAVASFADFDYNDDAAAGNCADLQTVKPRGMHGQNLPFFYLEWQSCRKRKGNLVAGFVYSWFWLVLPRQLCTVLHELECCLRVDDCNE